MTSSDPSISTITPPLRSIRACSKRCCRTSPRSSATRRAAACVWLEGRGSRRERRARRSPRSSAPRPARSSSPAARPNPTTSRSRAARDALRNRGDHSSPSRPSTSRCSIRASGSRRRAGGSRVCGSTATAVLDLDALREALTDKTVLVSVMAANNEIGVLQPMAEIAAHRRTKPGALLHTDAAQAAGKVPIDVNAGRRRSAVADRTQVHGPEGRGALYVRRQKPKIRAGLPDRRRRPRERPPLGHAQRPGHRRAWARPRRSARREMPDESARLAALRDRLLAGLRANLDGVQVNGSMAHRLPHNLHVSFDGVDGEGLLMALGDLAVSTGFRVQLRQPGAVARARRRSAPSARAPARSSASGSAAAPPNRTSSSPSIASRPSSAAFAALPSRTEFAPTTPAWRSAQACGWFDRTRPQLRRHLSRTR